MRALLTACLFLSACSADMVPSDESLSGDGGAEGVEQAAPATRPPYKTTVATGAAGATAKISGGATSRATTTAQGGGGAPASTTDAVGGSTTADASTATQGGATTTETAVGGAQAVGGATSSASTTTPVLCPDFKALGVLGEMDPLVSTPIPTAAPLAAPMCRTPVPEGTYWTDVIAAAGQTVTSKTPQWYYKPRLSSSGANGVCVRVMIVVPSHPDMAVACSRARLGESTRAMSVPPVDHWVIIEQAQDKGRVWDPNAAPCPIPSCDTVRLRSWPTVD